MEADLKSLIERLEAVTSRLEQVGGHSGVGSQSSASVTEELTISVMEYDELLKGAFAQYLQLSAEIGGTVKEQSDIVKAAFQAQREFLKIASRAKQPDQAVLVKILEPISSNLQTVQEFKEKRRGDPFFNHLSAVSESIPALGWVTVPQTPGPYVKEFLDAGQFYTNRVIKDYKEKDNKHVDWTKSWIQTLTQLQAYIKQHHTTGIAWNPKGIDALSAVKPNLFPKPKGAAPPPPPPGGAPPPPPPPSAPLFQPDQESDSKAALFADLNKGLDITQSLKKVSDDMKTHKNPALRTGPQPYTPGPKGYKAPAVSSVAQKPQPVKPPLFELQGKKWIIENQKDQRELVVQDTEMKQVVYLYNCINSTVQVKGKINSITIDHCKNTGVVFENAVSSAEIVNCQRVQIQVTGKVPTITIDKTDGAQVFLSKDSLDVEIVSAKSSEMNISVPNESGEFSEFAVPEQYKTTWTGNCFKTVVAEQTG